MEIGASRDGWDDDDERRATAHAPCWWDRAEVTRAGAAGHALRGSGRPVVVATMVRHSKNAGTMGSEGLRYHERRALGFGTVKERLGAETVKNFDACALSLSHATDPVVTPEGCLLYTSPSPRD